MTIAHICLFASTLALAAPDKATPAASKPTTAVESKKTIKKKVAKKKVSKKTLAQKKTGKKKAGTSDTEALLTKIQNYYGKITDYQADFIQTYTKVALSQKAESRGTIEIKKPHYMRWTYAKPAEKLWIINDKTLWVVDPEFEQVVLDENFRTAEIERTVSFLWGKGRLDETFVAKLDGKIKTEAGQVALELTPKKGATYKKLVLLVDTKTGEVKESTLYETSGNTNRFRFRDAKLNQQLKVSRFDYAPPEGWEVIKRGG